MIKCTTAILALLALAAVAIADPAPNYNYKDLDGNWHNMNTYAQKGKYLAYDFVTLD